MVNPTNWKDYTSWPRTRRHVCVSGVIEEKGRENGREKRTPENTIGSEAGRLLSTSLHAAAQRSKVHVFLDGLGYLLLLQYL